jgi:hypothetical protein
MSDQKTIYIHIGTHKTGTSAIQDFLSLNKKVLKKKGYLFPQRSRRAYYTAIDNSYVVSKANHRSFRKLGELCRKQQKHVLLSSETFSLLDNISDIRMLLADCDVRIICYLRRQDDVIQSMYNQSIKEGGFYQDITVYQPYNLDYYEMLEKWASVFGKESIIVRLYDKQQFVNHSLIEDFLDILGLKLTDEFRTLQNNPNPRLSPVVMEYMRHVNCLLDDKAVAKKFKGAVLGFSAERFADATSPIFFHHALLSDEQIQAIMKTYRYSNSRVAREYLRRQDGQLFQEEASKTVQNTPIQRVLSDDMFLEITRYICKDRTFKKILYKAVKQDVSRKDDFTKTSRDRFLTALNELCK